MSSSPTRIHLIDAHQLRAIHPHGLSDYTRHHPLLSVRVNPPCRSTDICVFLLIARMFMENFLRARMLRILLVRA